MNQSVNNNNNNNIIDTDETKKVIIIGAYLDKSPAVELGGKYLIEHKYKYSNTNESIANK